MASPFAKRGQKPLAGVMVAFTALAATTISMVLYRYVLDPYWKKNSRAEAELVANAIFDQETNKNKFN